MHGFGKPLVLLGRHVRSGKDPLCRIDQEEDEDPAVTRFGRVLQPEWLDLVLVQVRERDASVGFRDYIADILDTYGIPDTDVSQFTG